MEDLPGYLANATTSLQGRKKTMDSEYDAMVQKDTSRKGRNGEVTGLFGIYAGFGGDRAAQLVKRNLTTGLVKDDKYGDDLETALGNVMMSMHKEIMVMWGNGGEKHGVSAVLVAIRDGHLYCTNAGNSGAVLCRAEGEMESLAKSSPRLDEQGNPPVVVVGLDWEDEFIILGCNGFWSKLSEAQACRMARASLKKFRDVNHAVQKLSYAAYVNGASSNISVTVIILNQETAMGELKAHTKLFNKLKISRGSSFASDASSQISMGAATSPRSGAFSVGGTTTPKSPAFAPSARHKAKKQTPTVCDSSSDRGTPTKESSRGSPLSRSGAVEDLDFDMELLRGEMERYAASHDFERAAKARDKMAAVEKMNQAVTGLRFEEAAKLRDAILKMHF